MKDLDTFAMRDPAAWQVAVDVNADPYGRCCIEYAARWARLMDELLAAGTTVAAVAKGTSDDADTEGITGFMYSMAVGLLARCWVHGEALRRWHNLDAQIGTEGEQANATGGVLNTALLHIRPESAGG